MRRLRFLPSARSDLIEILDYVAGQSRNLAVARRFVAALRPMSPSGGVARDIGTPTPRTPPGHSLLPIPGIYYLFSLRRRCLGGGEYPRRPFGTLTITFPAMLHGAVSLSQGGFRQHMRRCLGARAGGPMRRTATEPMQRTTLRGWSWRFVNAAKPASHALGTCGVPRAREPGTGSVRSCDRFMSGGLGANELRDPPA